MYTGARAADAAYARARALAAALDSAGGPDAAALRSQVDSLAPGAATTARGGRPAPKEVAPPTLNGARDAMLAAAMAMQRADVAPTAAQVEACRRARERSRVAMARWTTLSTNGLAAVNAKRRAAGAAPIALRE